MVEALSEPRDPPRAPIAPGGLFPRFLRCIVKTKAARSARISQAAQLCDKLMRADTEDDVVELLTQAGYWDDPSVWRYLGDNENNFAQIGNQQSEAVAALIEKIVNGVDARLMNAVLEAGIDPEDSDRAPGSMRETVARYFEGRRKPDLEKHGRISEWASEKATSEGRLLTVTATGRRPEMGNPSITITDGGEGQSPDDFPSTFMSISRSNKLRIPFVQGKFNMGGLAHSYSRVKVTVSSWWCHDGTRSWLAIDRAIMSGDSLWSAVSHQPVALAAQCSRTWLRPM